MVAFSCIFTATSFGQSAGHVPAACSCSVQGRVYDLQTKQPLPNAYIRIDSLNRSSVTNQEGAFELNQLCACKCHVAISFVGYKTFEETIDLSKDSVLTVYLTDEDKLLDNVLIQGEKTTSGISTLTENTLSGQELAKTQGRSLAESLEQLSGVSTLQTGASIGKPIVHGLHSNRILILNNGIRLEGQQWGAEHAPEIDPFIAKNISVIKGAATVKYGTEALGGVVVVKPPALRTRGGVGGEINAIGMSNGRLGAGSAMIEGGLRQVEGLGWRIQSTIKRGGDARAPDYYLTNTGTREFNYSLALGYQKKAYGIETFYSHFNTTLGILKATGYLGSLDDLQYAFENEPPQQTAPFSYDINNPRQVVSHDLFKANAYYETALGKLDLQYGLQRNHRKEFDIRFGALNDIPSMNLEITTHTLDVELSHKPLGLWQGSVGLNGMYQDNNNIPGTQRSNFIPNYNAYTGGIYAIERWIHPQWQLEGGIRYDYKNYNVRGFNQNVDIYRDAFRFQNVTASLGGSYDFSRRSSFSTNIGSAWRPPHVAELYSFGKHQSNAGIEYGLLWTWDRQQNNFYIEKFDQKDVKNEKGLKWINTYTYAGDRLETDVTAYLNYIRDYIYIRPEGVTIGNVGALPYFWYRQTDAVFAGLDFAMHYQLLSYLNWHNKVSLINAHDVRNDDELPYIPVNQWETGLELEKDTWKGWNDLYAEVTVAHFAKQQQAPRVVLIDALFEAAYSDQNIFGGQRNFDLLPAPEAYTLINIEAGFTRKFAHTSLSGRLGVHNLFNVAYRNYTNRLRYFADDIGRNFTAGVTYKFGGI